jgi:hypothetical protein
MGNEFILAPKQSGEYNGELRDVGDGHKNAAQSTWQHG